MFGLSKAIGPYLIRKKFCKPEKYTGKNGYITFENENQKFQLKTVISKIVTLNVQI